MELAWTGKSAAILDFDCECRPLAWYGGDFVTKQPTVIAYKMVGSTASAKTLYIGASHEPDNLYDEEVEMLEAFRAVYDRADIVTGHFIRGFDLPLLNGARIRVGLPPLDHKLTHDTKLDFAVASGLSKSQENLGAMFELEHPKVPMDTTLWAQANMLTTAGIKMARERATGDVEQHIELRDEMTTLDLLKAPSLWTGEASGRGKYHA